MAQVGIPDMHDPKTYSAGILQRVSKVIQLKRPPLTADILVDDRFRWRRIDRTCVGFVMVQEGNSSYG
jgi:hypothetical protein